MPEPHPQVLNIIKLLKPIEYPPNLPMLAKTETDVLAVISVLELKMKATS